MAQKLSRSELALISREGERIKNGLTKVIDSFPNNARTITGMANWLKANKSTCQRMVETINKAVDGLQVIHLLPGPEGINKFLDLAAQNNINKKLIAGAREVVYRFENLIFEYSRSHSALKQLIKSSLQNKEVLPDKLELRKTLYEAAKNITGENIETAFKFFILKENEEDAQYLQQYTLSFHENCKQDKNSRPMMFAANSCEQQLTLDKLEIVSVDSHNNKVLPTFGIVKELTSETVLESVDQALSGDGWVVLPTEHYFENDFNIGVIKNYPFEQRGPFHGGQKASCVSAMIRGATKRLNLICFLHRKYAMRSAANIGIYSTNTKLVNMISSPDSLWFDRFQDDLDLLLYNTTVNFNEKLDHPLANHLVDLFFNLTDCDKSDFSCYLVQVDYPIWASQYRMYFQYAVD